MHAGELAGGITFLVLICIGLIAAIYTRYSRKKEASQAESTAEQGHVKSASISSKRSKSTPPQMPLFKTRSSLSMSSSPSTPRTPKTPKSPGIRFSITPPSHRSRKSGSIDSLPSVETVLEQYEREADAAERLDKAEHNQILQDKDLGEPGPSVVEQGPVEEKRSAWDRPHIAMRAAGEA